MTKTKKKKKSRKPLTATSVARGLSSSNCYQGDCLSDILLKLGRSIEAAKQLKGQLPEKIWIKQQFAIGVNDVTRVLERMPRGEVVAGSVKEPIHNSSCRAPLVPLQAVILASDVNPRLLTKHIPSLASSRQVPVIYVKDNKGGSMRLGELVKLKTTMAIGVKVRESIVNKTIDEIILRGSSLVEETIEIDQQTTIGGTVCFASGKPTKKWTLGPELLKQFQNC